MCKLRVILEVFNDENFTHGVYLVFIETRNALKYDTALSDFFIQNELKILM